MANIPTINFKSSLSEEEFQKLDTEVRTRTSKVFEPGTHDLKIVEVAKNITEANPLGVSKSDPTWSVFKVTLGGLDQRTIRYYLLAPTVRDTFQSPTMAEKHKFLMAQKFRKFMRGVGIDTKHVGLAAFSQKLHADPDSLVGLDVRVIIGYTGPHLKYNEDPRGYVIVDRRGNPLEKLDGAIFPDRDAARIAAATDGLVLQSFAEVLAFEDMADVEGSSTNEVW